MMKEKLSHENKMSHETTLICMLVVLCSLLRSVGAPSAGVEGGTADGDNRGVGVLPQTLLLCFSICWTGEVWKHKIHFIVINAHKGCLSY